MLDPDAILRKRILQSNRSARHYRRRRLGRRVYAISVDEAGLEALLTNSGFLTLLAGDDDHTILRKTKMGLQQLLAVMIADDERHG